MQNLRIGTLLASFMCVVGSAPATAGVTPYAMQLEAVSRTCVGPCLLISEYVLDTDFAEAAGGSFADLSVSTGVAAGLTTLEASTSGSTSVDSDTSFTVHLVTSRPGTQMTNAAYRNAVEASFSFQTDASGGAMEISYLVHYQRPSDGSSLDTGVSFGTPYELYLFGGQSAAPLSFASLSGTNSDTWSYALQPNTYYDVRLAASHERAFNSNSGSAADSLDATFVVTLPSFAQPVPEPPGWGMLLAGMLLAGVAARRRRVVAGT